MFAWIFKIITLFLGVGSQSNDSVPELSPQEKTQNTIDGILNSLKLCRLLMDEFKVGLTEAEILLLIGRIGTSGGAHVSYLERNITHISENHLKKVLRALVRDNILEHNTFAYKLHKEVRDFMSEVY